MNDKAPALNGRLAALQALNRWRHCFRWVLLAGALLFVSACWALVYMIGELVAFVL